MVNLLHQIITNMFLKEINHGHLHRHYVHAEGDNINKKLTHGHLHRHYVHANSIIVRNSCEPGQSVNDCEGT